MYLLATVCLLNVLTVRGTDEGETVKERLEKLKEKWAKETAKVKASDEFKQCETDYKKKYENTAWNKSLMGKIFARVRQNTRQNQCYYLEHNICLVTNDIIKKFDETLEAEEKEILYLPSKVLVRNCKTALDDNSDCKAECDKFSWESSSTPIPNSTSLSTTGAISIFNDKSNSDSDDIGDRIAEEVDDRNVEEGLTSTTTPTHTDEEEDVQNEGSSSPRRPSSDEEYAEKKKKELGVDDEKVKATDAYKQCVTDYEKKYTEAKWEKNAKKESCYGLEDAICVATNDIMKQFAGKLDGMDKEVCTSKSLEAVSLCKAELVDNPECKADCDKLSAASTVTTTVLFALSALAFLSK